MVGAVEYAALCSGIHIVSIRTYGKELDSFIRILGQPESIAVHVAPLSIERKTPPPSVPAVNTAGQGARNERI